MAHVCERGEPSSSRPNLSHQGSDGMVGGAHREPPLLVVLVAVELLGLPVELVPPALGELTPPAALPARPPEPPAPVVAKLPPTATLFERVPPTLINVVSSAFALPPSSDGSRESPPPALLGDDSEPLSPPAPPWDAWLLSVPTSLVVSESSELVEVLEDDADEGRSAPPPAAVSSPSLPPSPSAGIGARLDTLCVPPFVVGICSRALPPVPRLPGPSPSESKAQPLSTPNANTELAMLRQARARRYRRVSATVIPSPVVPVRAAPSTLR